VYYALVFEIKTEIPPWAYFAVFSLETVQVILGIGYLAFDTAEVWGLEFLRATNISVTSSGDGAITVGDTGVSPPAGVRCVCAFHGFGGLRYRLQFFLAQGFCHGTCCWRRLGTSQQCLKAKAQGRRAHQPVTLHRVDSW
jgi:hypothetical protein